MTYRYLLTILSLVYLLFPSPSMAAAPDLIVIAPTVSRLLLYPGQSFTFDAYVKNQGTATAAATTLRYYRSTNDTITIGDSPIGTDFVPSLTAPTGLSHESISLSAPAAGTYWIGACVDAVSGETATSNQCSLGEQITVTDMPDLVVPSLSVSDTTLMPGQLFDIDVYIKNEGTTTAAATTLRYYRSTNDTITTGDSLIGTDSVASLTPSWLVHKTISVKALIAPTGTYWIGACVDTVAGELITDNQCSFGVQITVTNMPDLTVPSALTLTPPLTPGQSYTIYAAVENIGTATADATKLRFYQSINSTISTKDKELTTLALASLGAGNILLSLDGNVKASLTPGNYWVGACVDTVANEADTANQCSTGMRITIINGPSSPTFPWTMFLPAIISNPQ